MTLSYTISCSCDLQMEFPWGKYNSAIKAFTKAIMFNPRDPLNYSMRGKSKMIKKITPEP
jgi:hypothetical protein